MTDMDWDSGPLIRAQERMLDMQYAEIWRLRDAIISARQELAKGRALWNGPCHQCDAVLKRAIEKYEE